jgi:hypothetical protein
MVVARAVDDPALATSFRKAARKHVLASSGWDAQLTMRGAGQFLVRYGQNRLRRRPMTTSAQNPLADFAWGSQVTAKGHKQTFAISPLRRPSQHGSAQYETAAPDHGGKVIPCPETAQRRAASIPRTYPTDRARSRSAPVHCCSRGRAPKHRRTRPPSRRACPSLRHAVR